MFIQTFPRKCQLGNAKTTTTNNNTNNNNNNNNKITCIGNQRCILLIISVCRALMLISGTKL